jgi:hypothetical protein
VAKVETNVGGDINEGRRTFVHGYCRVISPGAS